MLPEQQLLQFARLALRAIVRQQLAVGEVLCLQLVPRRDAPLLPAIHEASINSESVGGLGRRIEVRNELLVKHPAIVRTCGRMSTTADDILNLQAVMSSSVDMSFSERLRAAAKHAKVDWSQTAVAKSLGYSKQTVDRWFGTGEPKPAQVFKIADRWKISARWLATGEGQMAPASSPETGNAREEMMLMLFRSLTPEQQRELVLKTNAAVDANREVQQRFLGTPLRTYSNEDVRAAFGDVPKPAKPPAKTAKKRRKGFLEEDPE